MRQIEKLISILSVLLILLSAVHLVKELQLFSLFIIFFELLYSLMISTCFVLLFEPLIEKVPLKNRSAKCTVIYLFLFIMILLLAVLFVPVIMNEWEHIVDLIQKILSMSRNDAEMVFSYEEAVDSTLSFVRKFMDIALSYLMAYFLSLEFPEIRCTLCKSSKISCFFEIYDDFKEMIFQYIKAIGIDVSLIFVSQWLVLTIFDVKYAFSLAFGLALLNVIPYFGAFIGQVLIFLVDYLITGKFRLFLILCVILIQQIESNCIQPLLYGKLMNLKPIYMFTSILFFGSLMGMAGVLFAPIFAVAIQFVFQKMTSDLT